MVMWATLLSLVAVAQIVTVAEACFGGGGKLPQASFTCGVNDVNPKIVGGSDAAPNSVPWQVALVSPWVSSGKPFCGGTIISPYHVLTAAHCVWVPAIWVKVGEHNIETNDDKATIHKVDCIHRHPHYFYYWGWANNDFAILTLKTPLDLTGPNSLARAACLPNDDIPEFRHNQTMFTVSGWGLMEEKGEEQPEVLQKVDVPYFTPVTCAEAYADKTNYTGLLITSSMMCAGHEGGETGACFGDSGGPLTLSTSGKEHVVGVVSWGIGCGRPNLPSVYAKVSSANWWIHQRGVDSASGIATKRCPRPWWG